VSGKIIFGCFSVGFLTLLLPRNIDLQIGGTTEFTIFQATHKRSLE